jgi:hypothetical protein
LNEYQGNAKETCMKRWLTGVVMAAGTSMFAAAPAHAGGNVFWSIGIHAPLDPYGATIGTTISNAPYWHRPAPVYVQPAPIVVPPAPVYYRPGPIVVKPYPVYQPYPRHYHARPVVVHPGHHGHQPHHGHSHWKRGDHDGNGRWDRGDRRDRWDRHPGRHGRD